MIDQINIGDKVHMKNIPDVVGTVRTIRKESGCELFRMDWPVDSPHARFHNQEWIGDVLVKVADAGKEGK